MLFYTTLLRLHNGFSGYYKLSSRYVHKQSLANMCQLRSPGVHKGVLRFNPPELNILIIFYYLSKGD